ncbi:hypothetical protein GCM10010435_61560 [Winogradskya consettensis]|uniref:HTH luxR-type domain-containing protein n=1 Tax=Winogradskya consettensis TaxID=113560 RepID=A0A919SPH6_9ACTN|nr:helix-turn-helix transcriptional regulator [Actinoplanes consettensis]GIM76162.1 hypothetical protein Aco04nite_48990 [Actinoplanes consettensis]
MAEARFSAQGFRARAVRRAISDLAAEEPPARELLDEVETRLRQVIRFDTGAWWTSDPETLLPTESGNFDLAAIERELSVDGGVRLEGLDGKGSHDLRVVARSGQSAWGSACLTRDGGAQPFTAEEFGYVGGIAKDVGFALRADLLRTAMESRPDRGSATVAPGVGTLVLGGSDAIEGFTPDARTWLARLGMADLSSPLPTALRWISLEARARRPARSRLGVGDGGLVAVQAEALHGAASPKVVMSLEPASSRSLFPLLLALHDLTAREKTVARLIVAGWPLEEIATHLTLSLHTVRDHVKAIYAKVGVRSRPELTARLGGVPAGDPLF